MTLGAWRGRADRIVCFSGFIPAFAGGESSVMCKIVDLCLPVQFLFPLPILQPFPQCGCLFAAGQPPLFVLDEHYLSLVIIIFRRGFEFLSRHQSSVLNRLYIFSYGFYFSWKLSVFFLIVRIHEVVCYAYTECFLEPVPNFFSVGSLVKSMYAVSPPVNKSFVFVYKDVFKVSP